MRTDQFKNVLAQRNQVLWMILAFQSGFMNAGGFLSCHQFVSHITGYGTEVGIEVGQKAYFAAFGTALAPLFFLFGAIYAGWLVDRRVIQGKEPRLETGIVTLALLNLAIYAGGLAGFFGEFGEPLILSRDFLLLFSLCFACGLQNGLFTGLTSGQVRTTHITGPTTDIGLNIAKAFTLGRDDPERGTLVAQNWLRAKVIIAFSGGSMIATMAFSQLKYEGFAIPFALSLFLIWYIRKLLRLAHGATAAAESPSVMVPVEPTNGGGVA
ncbi:YoaK family protein [Isosphaeraceae bacterium EP7]